MRRRWWVAAMGLLGACAGLAGAVLRLPPAGPPEGTELLPGASPPSAPSQLRVWSWNIHYGAGATARAGRATAAAETRAHLDAIAAALRSHEVDVVLLQEVDRAGRRAHGIDQLQHLRAASGLGWAAFVETWRAGWVPYPFTAPSTQIGEVHSGIAVLSRFPLAGLARHALPQIPSRPAVLNRLSLHRALLDVELDIGAGRRVRVFNAHLESADRPNREQQAALVAARLRTATGPLLFGGDINAPPPEAPQQGGFSDEPNEDHAGETTVPTLRAVPGLLPVLDPAAFAAAPAAFATYPAEAPSRRIDELFVGGGLRVLSTRVPVVAPAASDHRPVEAVLALPPP
jgi:endonuclease/exonuclease/phosphatase family metal-dependent hydrolase